MGLQGRANRPSVLAAAKSIGIDVDLLLSDMQSPEIDEHIGKSSELAEMLGFSGTPSFVIGENLAPGLIPLDELIQFVAQARSGE
jgi:protein-disulfide isomerase